MKKKKKGEDSAGAEGKKKKGGVKKFLLIFIPLVALISGLTGALFLGLIKIPGLKLPFGKNPTSVAKASPAKKKTPPKPAVPKTVAKPVTPPPVAIKTKPAPTTDPAKGIKKVAKLWNELEPAKLQLIIADWKDPDLARVLSKMDADKVSQLLASLPPKRASALSRAIQVEASKLPPPTSA